MSIKIGINGFGRIGRCVYRVALQREGISVVGVNDIAEPRALAYLLKYDTVMGRLDADVSLEGDTLVVADERSRLLAERDPAALPWKDLGVDFVVEATGRFKSRADLQKHLDAGAPRVVLTVPPADELDATVVLGVNEEVLTADARLVSNASCTTNCLGPLAKVLHGAFGIDKGLMTTVHAYTNDQRLAEVPDHKDLRRSRAAAENIIPTTTGAARAVGKVMPELAGRLDGVAMRVPIPDGSTVDLVAELQSEVTAEEVNRVVREAAEGPLRGIIQYNEEPLVSSDIIGNPHSCIYDAELTQVTGGRLLRCVAWYDNEWGYSNRVVDLIERLHRLAS
ncbi:MAG: type I glyceraldehyde-3-phosphate dehydrogenase [Planctomycetota bacterium]|nr:MAG: type I glyceraldehyde-3-phosphate dehydrogenase [Planctomycetota bacterium]